MNKELAKIFKIIFVFINLSPMILHGQSENIGIKFESGLSWKDIQAKAKTENKYIFVDCFATWCGPCKWMSRNVFSQGLVGEFMNRNFVNVVVQMDQTADDVDNIKNWYLDAKMIADSFFVNEYPTYLFFTPDGQLVHRFTGSTENGDAFIVKAVDVLNPYTQYYNLLRHWKEYTNDTSYLFSALTASVKLHSNQGAIIEKVYIDQLKNPVTKENIQLFGQMMKSSNDRAFSLFLQNLSEIRDLVGDGYAESKLCPIIFKEETQSFFQAKNVPIYWNKIAGCLRKYPELDQIPRFEELFRQKIQEEIVQYLGKDNHSMILWNNIYKIFTKRYPDYNIELIFLQSKLFYCQHNGLDEEQARAALAILNQYGNILGDWEMNDLVWYHIFNITGDKEVLNGALRWMKMSISRRSNIESYDTYANLLYKTGNLVEAIIWEKKCVELTTGSSYGDEFKIALEKMNNKKPTWKDGTSVTTIYSN